MLEHTERIDRAVSSETQTARFVRGAPFWRYLPRAALVDPAVLSLAFLTAYQIRFDFQLPPLYAAYSLTQLPYVVLIQFLSLYLAGVYDLEKRYSGPADFFKAGLLATLLLLIFRLAMQGGHAEWRLPLGVILLDGLLAFGGVGFLRPMSRSLLERVGRPSWIGSEASAGVKPILLVGAGEAGKLALRGIRNLESPKVEVLGFVDDDTGKKGTVIEGVEVLGNCDQLSSWVRSLAIDHVVITIASASAVQVRRIVEICRAIPVRVRTIPRLDQIVAREADVSSIRDIRIEDLLNRAPVEMGSSEVREFIGGKTVMVTGAGGSIGAELARQVAKMRASRVLLVERSESALFELQRKLDQHDGGPLFEALLADVGDEATMRGIFSSFKPHLVFHAAAHKHVPMMEFNVAEAIRNNVLATRLLGELSGSHGVEALVLISTDKAVRPVSVMGASKRLAELVVQDLDERFPTRFVAVRFGNVLGSAGSVVPVFRDQIERGGPVTVTHPEMTRYFMTPTEATGLVLQAGAMHEGSAVYTLDMGAQIRILDLAQDMISLMGLRPFKDIAVEFTGVRPGEKLQEELELDNAVRTHHDKIRLSRPDSLPSSILRDSLQHLARLTQTGCHDDDIIEFLNQLLPEANLAHARSLSSTA